jgi:hypothetical protein
MPAWPSHQAWVSQRRLKDGVRARDCSDAAEANANIAPKARGGTPPRDGAIDTHAARVATIKPPRQASPARQNPKCRVTNWNGGGACMGSAAGRGVQTRLNTRVPLVPPKPKLFFTAYSIFISRAVLAQ